MPSNRVGETDHKQLQSRSRTFLPTDLILLEPGARRILGVKPRHHSHLRG